MTAILEHIVFQHAEDASALWHQRRCAAADPHYTLRELIELDDRVSANIEGLLIAGSGAEPHIAELLSAEDDGALFTMTIVALESGKQDMLEAALQNVVPSSTCSDSIIQVASALAWVRPELLTGVVRNLLNESQAVHSILGLLACAAHGKATQGIVQPHLKSSDPVLRTIANRVAANAGLVGLMSKLVDQSDCDDVRERFEFARAVALLGDKPRAIKLLLTIVNSESVVAREALKLYLQLASGSECKALLKELDGTDGRERDVVIGFGVLGDPVAIPWLIARMEDPLFNRLAGEALSMITGVDIVGRQLDLAVTPEDAIDAGPNDDPEDDNVELEEDEDLPWVDAQLVSEWWQGNSDFAVGHRYLAGYPKTAEGMHAVLKNGLQRQRILAATSLALLQPEKEYLDTALPGRRQMELLC